jgi:hypothetical protein
MCKNSKNPKEIVEVCDIFGINEDLFTYMLI